MTSDSKKPMPLKQAIVRNEPHHPILSENDVDSRALVMAETACAVKSMA